jgi:sugar O-acyltransferase (sialic acid O-acetyltransferase NeuD family)
MKIGLLGSGGQADEVESYLGEGDEVVFRAVNKDYLDGSNPKMIDINEPGDNQETEVIAALGTPGLRKKMADNWPGKKYSKVVSSKALVDSKAEIGQGAIIAPGAVITTNAKIGEHVLVNVNATISHDCRIGDFVTISPGAHIAGRVTIGNGVFVGIGAVVSNDVKIADGVVIGAGAVVLDDINEANAVAVGIPAKVVKLNDGWISEI